MDIINIDLGNGFTLKGIAAGSQIQGSIYDKNKMLENTFGFWNDANQAINWLNKPITNN